MIVKQPLSELAISRNVLEAFDDRGDLEPFDCCDADRLVSSQRRRKLIPIMALIVAAIFAPRQIPSLVFTGNSHLWHVMGGYPILTNGGCS